MVKVEKVVKNLKEGSRLSFREVRAILVSLGFELKRQRGSHEQWIKQGRAFTLPCHGKEVPFYILDELKNIWDQQDEKR